jgi:hypothetical protein
LPYLGRGAFQGFLVDHEVRRHTLILRAPVLLRPNRGVSARYRGAPCRSSAQTGGDSRSGPRRLENALGNEYRFRGRSRAP